MQRTGRKGHAMFRVVVQDAHRTPTSGKVVAFLGSYDPHAKTATLAKDKASFYLEHGAQPSERVARLLKSEGVKLPKWVKIEDKKPATIKNLEKLRRNRPAEPKVAEAPAEPEATETPTETVAEESPAEPTKPEVIDAATKEKVAEVSTEPAEEVSATEAEPVSIEADTDSPKAE